MPSHRPSPSSVDLAGAPAAPTGPLDVWVADLEARRDGLLAVVQAGADSLAEREAGAAVPTALQLQLCCVILEAHQQLEAEAAVAATVIAELAAASEQEAAAIQVAASAEAIRIRLVADRLREASIAAPDGATRALGAGAFSGVR